VFHTPYVLVVGLLVSEGVSWQAVGEAVMASCGGQCLGYTEVSAHRSDYYESEMGPGLRRVWMGVRLPDPLYPLSQLKQWSRGLESEWMRHGNRQVNIDPGVLTTYQLLLLSTKNYAHRIPILDGIYGEVALIRQKKQWHPVPWTYPDYRTEGLWLALDRWIKG